MPRRTRLAERIPFAASGTCTVSAAFANSPDVPVSVTFTE